VRTWERGPPSASAEIFIYLQSVIYLVSFDIFVILDIFANLKFLPSLNTVDPLSARTLQTLEIHGCQDPSNTGDPWSARTL
jgi:hypothetical protein